MDTYKKAKEKEKYLVRNEVLKSIGYSSYKEYLQSDEWKSIRSAVKEKYSECICCNSHVEVIHHVRYASYVLLGLHLEELAPLCHKCHEAIELTDGEKNTLQKANMKLFDLARKKDAKQQWLNEFYHKGKSRTGKYWQADTKESMRIKLQIRDMKKQQGL